MALDIRARNSQLLGDLIAGRLARKALYQALSPVIEEQKKLMRWFDAIDFIRMKLIHTLLFISERRNRL